MSLRRRPRRVPRTAYVSAAVLVCAATAVTVAAAPSDAAAARLGLPSLSKTHAYDLAPASRTVRPSGVHESWRANTDYVTAAQPVSETDAHDLRTSPTSTTTTTDGVTVRQAGPDDPAAWFSYRLHVPKGRAFTLRVEEAGSADAAYDVLVGSETVHQRKPDPAQSGVWHDLVGLVHYDVAVPAQLAGSTGEVTVTFRNAADPGPGARIAGVWALADAALATSEPYGGSVTSAGGAAGTGDTVLRSNIFGRPYVIYDFGRDVGGTMSFTAHASGHARLGLAFSESEQFMTTASDFSQDAPGIATETHYFPLHNGTSRTTDPVIRGGFRYLMVFLDSPGEVSLSNLRLHFTADPTNPAPQAYRGAFLSSDTTLNRLWYSGAYTVQLATIDPTTGRPYPAKPGPVTNDATVGDGRTVISDGGKRDRMIWGGDNAVSDVVSMLTTGESEPARNAVAFLAKGQFDDGQVPGVFLPGGAGYQTGWGEYAAWWIANYWSYYLYTGDRAFLDQYWPTLQKDVAWFETLVGDDGLLDVPSAVGGHWGYGNSGKETFDNALYAYVLGLAAQAAGVEGSALADTYRQHADRTRSAINDQLWDAGTGAYVEKPGATDHPQDANALALLSGTATGARADAVRSFFASTLAGPVGDLTNDADGGTVPRYVSPFVTGQALAGLAAQHSGAADEQAISLIDRTWAHMLGGDQPGTLWENVSTTGGLQLGSYTSMAHGWATAPTSYLTNTVLGVQPTAGGFSSFQVLPHPAGGPRWAEGRVPTPHGTITVAWKRSAHGLDLQVHAPKGTTATVGVPATGVTRLTSDSGLTWRPGSGSSKVTSRDGYLQLAGVTGTTTLHATLG